MALLGELDVLVLRHFAAQSRQSSTSARPHVSIPVVCVCFDALHHASSSAALPDLIRVATELL